MTLDYIERAYGRRFTEGQRVIALGKPGVVTGGEAHVWVQLDGLKHSNPYHPTDVEPVSPNGEP